MSVPVLLTLLNSSEKAIKCLASLTFYLFTSTSLINSIIHEYTCKILYFLTNQVFLPISCYMYMVWTQWMTIIYLKD